MALKGIKVIEFAGLAPGPFAGLILADNGASVIRVDRPGATSVDTLCRGKRSIVINPKVPSGNETLLKLISSADVLIDPYRPGVLERLGLGPEVFLGADGKKGLNTRLIYARMAGFPRTGKQKDMAGHDINYLASSGILSMLPGMPDRPSFPLNLLADFAGGGLTCASGILLALLARAQTGRGQVVNTDMVSGVRYLSSFPLILKQHPIAQTFSGPRGSNLLDGGAPFYSIYPCKDGAWMSVGCLEPQFFRVFIEGFVKALPLEFRKSFGWTPTPETQVLRGDWPRLREYLEKGFRTRNRDEWAQIFHGTDACAVPVLTPQEAVERESFNPIPKPHPHVVGLGENNASGVSNPGDFSTLMPGQHTDEILGEIGLSEADRKKLLHDKAIEAKL
ncbi:alpha-methylacyl- racemase [Moniliophthora roreri MCA 2997]|uniref:Alpha-methylacyl-racemase n=1 Tax=Moniliophthora roreri (strain MCA 2997) TaxID=1381753 RepID=V2YBF2_MONRO|nr:alpha-methylacyl- racemase [Moniliophthora roreri MCA 2997]